MADFSGSVSQNVASGSASIPPVHSISEGRILALTNPAGVRPRVQSLDILRGLVMIIMALDHVRDFLHYGAQHFDPADVARTTPALFFTRWITHFCAPAFMFLAGASAYLYSRRGRSQPEVARFLVTRGLWLVFLELTWVLCLGWKMNFKYDQIFFWVIWALGFSMIVLAGLIFLRPRLLLALSLAVIVLHNALDPITPAQLEGLGWLWKILHVLDTIPVSTHLTILNNYPLLPWIFVMSAGYCFGRVLDLAPDRRKQFLLRLGAALTVAFVLLRWSNVYGDMHPWATRPSVAMTIASFLNVTKYPPSLLYLLMTLGPGIFILGLADRIQLRDSNPLIVFGRVPLFYYLLHLPLIHLVSIALAWFRYRRIDFMLNNPPSLAGPAQLFPVDYGYNLAIVYLVWIGVVVALYPLCKWFSAVKQKKNSVLLSYL
jgi:uncharacterized membrane protein